MTLLERCISKRQNSTWIIPSVTNSKVIIAFSGSFRSTYEHQSYFIQKEREKGEEDGSKVSTQTCVRCLKRVLREKDLRKIINNFWLIIITLIGQTGNSGKAAATARAPASLVNSERPTKNSLPVNSTSPPSSFAFGSEISTKAKSNSFLRIARTFSTCWWFYKK